MARLHCIRKPLRGSQKGFRVFYVLRHGTSAVEYWLALLQSTIEMQLCSRAMELGLFYKVQKNACLMPCPYEDEGLKDADGIKAETIGLAR